MSLALPALQVVKVLDPRVNINRVPKFAVLKSGTQITYQRFSAPSTSTQNVQFTANPPNSGTIVSRRVYMRWFVALTFQEEGPATAGPLLALGTNDGFRCLPISSVINSLQATINNQTLSVNLNNYLQPFLRYHNSMKTQDADLSMSPSMLDTFQQVEDWQQYGSAKNPLSAYGENSAQQSRGGFVYGAVVNEPDTGVAQVAADLTEPLFLSPFSAAGHSKAGFYGVQTMTFNFQLGYGSTPNLSYMWQHGGDKDFVAGAPVVTFRAPPQMLFQYITPDPTFGIPAQISYNYHTVTTYSQLSGDLDEGETEQVSLGNIQLNSIPHAIYIWSRKSQADASIRDTDTYGGLTALNITFQNKSSILASATEQDLYQIAARNGVELSWPQWSEYVGAPIKLIPALDLGLASEQAAGSVGSYNLVVQATVKNLNPESRRLQVWVAIVSESVLTIVNQQAVVSDGVLTSQDVLTANLDESMDFEELDRHARYLGAGFFSSIGDFVKKALPIASTVADYLPIGAPIKTGLKVASKLAGGRKMKGSGVVSRSELAARLA
jgi:hypothetical protein